MSIFTIVDWIGEQVIKLFTFWRSSRRHLDFNSYICLRYSEASFKRMPKQPGIYAIVKGNNVLYIGKSKSLYQRWNQAGDRVHHRKALLFQVKADSICYYIANASDIDKLELSAIRYHKPVFNNVSKELRI